MRFAISLCVAAAVLAVNPARAEGIEAVKLKDVKWASCDPKAANDPCQIVYFRGNPETEPNHSYFKVPQGYLFSAHWHTGNSIVVVLKGAFTVGGEHDTKGTTLQVGDFAYEPARWIHWGRCDAKECVVYLHVDGPDSYIDIKDRRP